MSAAVLDRVVNMPPRRHVDTREKERRQRPGEISSGCRSSRVGQNTRGRTSGANPDRLPTTQIYTLKILYYEYPSLFSEHRLSQLLKLCSCLTCLHLLLASHAKLTEHAKLNPLVGCRWRDHRRHRRSDQLQPPPRMAEVAGTSLDGSLLGPL